MNQSLNGFAWLAMTMFLIVATLAANSSQAQLIVAHRGASEDAPENTMAAFQLAWQQQADAIEGDFYLTSDGQIVALHDRTTKRTAGQELEVAQTPLETLRQLDVGAWKSPRFRGERIPTLKEVLAAIPPGKKIFIEVKCGPEIVSTMKQCLMQSRLSPEQTVVISFNADVIAETKRQIPAIKAYWLTGFKQDEATGEWKPDLDLEFHVWTVDNPADAAFFQQLGVDSITTNRPGVMRRELW